MIYQDQRQHWQELVQQFKKVTDGLGRRIDTGIFETVIAVNALGLQTIMSCEGHMKSGTKAPYVDIHVEEASILLERAKQAQDQNDYERVDAILNQAQILTYRELQKLYNPLQRFYEHHPSAYDCHLTLRYLTVGDIRIESQGVPFQATREPAEARACLKAYQREMVDFTVFTKAQLFSGGR